MYRAIIFDCDGTLLDAKIMIRLLYDGYRRFYPQRPSKTYEEFICCYYFTNVQTQKYLDIPDEEYEAFIRFSFGDKDEIMNTTKMFTGIADVTRELDARGIVLGINTSRIPEHMVAVREQLTPSVYDRFRIIVTSKDVRRPKPAPDSMERIAEQLGMDMKDILYIGDSDSDAACAKAAGCDFALAGWGLVGEHVPKADVFLREPADILKLLS